MRQEDFKPEPDRYFHLFVGSEVNQEVTNAFGEYLTYLTSNIQKLPKKQQILNATFEFNLEKCKEYFSNAHRQLRETLDKDIEETKDKVRPNINLI